jgi:glycolate oxidase FAD binding subunit
MMGAEVHAPDDEAGVAEVVAEGVARAVAGKSAGAAIAAGRVPLAIRGGGTRAGLGHPVAGAVLDLSRLAGITLYEPGALTLVAKAGTPLAAIEAALAAEGQRLAFEPWQGAALYGGNGVATIGGAVAVNASGPRRVQAGACRDSLIGLRFVDGLGNIVRNGGRVMKNVTGYDLVKLLAGSHGTLGVLTEVAFKVLPRPEAQTTLVLPGLDPAGAVAAMAAALGSPHEVSGAAHDPGTGTLLRVEGFAAQVAHRLAGLRALPGRFGDARVVEDADWAGIRDGGAVTRGDGDIWRVSVRPSDGPAVVRLAGTGIGAGAMRWLMDWGGGLVWLALPPGTDLRARLAGIAGHATLMRAAEADRQRLGVFQPAGPVQARLEAGLRARFDPHGILNPGRMGA